MDFEVSVTVAIAIIAGLSFLAFQRPKAWSRYMASLIPFIIGASGIGSAFGAVLLAVSLKPELAKPLGLGSYQLAGWCLGIVCVSHVIHFLAKD